MVNRREVMFGGVAVASYPALVGAFSARAQSPAFAAMGDVPFYKVIYDERFAAGVDFAQQAREQGLAVQAIRGDMTDVWYRDLRHKWQKEPAAIAGLTAYGALFCLERLAWDVNMRATHSELRTDGLYAWVIAPRRRA